MRRTVAAELTAQCDTSSALAPAYMKARPRLRDGVRLPRLGGCSPFILDPALLSVTLLVAAFCMLWLLVALSIIKD
jgi:hypothetical protein